MMTTIQTLFCWLGCAAFVALVGLLIAWVVKFIERVGNLEQRNTFLKDEVRLNEASAGRAASRLNEVRHTDIPAIHERLARLDRESKEDNEALLEHKEAFNQLLLAANEIRGDLNEFKMETAAKNLSPRPAPRKCKSVKLSN